MNLIPWRERNSLTGYRSDLDNLFERFFDGDAAGRLPEAFRRGPVPPVNVSESDKDFAITVELPGLEEKDIDVQLLGHMLVISGERKWEQEKKGKEFHRVESQYGAFRRQIELPENSRTEADAITASYAKGILEVRVPKVEPRAAAKIAVKAR